MCATETDFPMWVLVFERIGPGSAILVFTGVVLWKLLPALTKLLGAWKKQSERITESVPVALDGLRDLVQHAERIADYITSPQEEHGSGGAGGSGIRLHRDHSHPSVPPA